MVTGSEQPVEIEKIKTTETSSQNGISKRSIIISEQKNSKTVRYTGISPILEPINMDLTRNKRSTAKLGIGIQKHQKDQNLRKRELQMKRIQENAAKQAKLAEQFAENSKRDHEVVMWWNDLKKSQKSCEDLDIRVKKLGTPEFSYFWYSEVKIEDDEVEVEVQKTEDEGLDPEDVKMQLDHVTLYLREEYFYCMYCGIKFDDEQDMVRNCPGDTRKEHDD